MPPTPQPAPESLVDAAGRVRFGVFDGPLRRLELERARLELGGLPMPAAWSRFRLKRWQHVALVLPDLFVGLAVVDTGLLRTSWCHVVDRAAGGQFEHSRLGPWLNLRVADTLWDDGCHVRARGYRIAIDNRLAHGEHRIALDIAAAGGRPSVHVSLRCPHDLAEIEPLVVSLPIGPNRALYSHKVPLPVSGTIRVGDKLHEVNPHSCFALWDVHRAHYPRRTFWNWATFAGRDAAGRALALNLTRNVNRDDERYNENALWIDGKLHHLGPATFDFDARDHLAPWRPGTAGGAVELRFEPEGERHDDVRLRLIESVFHQAYGRFFGTVRIPGSGGEPSEVVRIDGLFGVCEDHHAVW